MSKLLFNEQPLVVDKHLAALIGLNEAMVLQQIHYWIEINKKVGNNHRENKYWTYNTIQEWQKEFPFWSYDTVKRTLAKLRKQGILITGNFNKLKMDRTIWYTIDYDLLEKLNKEHEDKKNEDEEEPTQTLESSNSAECPNEENSISADCPNAKEQNNPMHQSNLPSPLPEISTETSSEISKSISQSIDNIDNNEIKMDRLTDYENREDNHADLWNEYYLLIERLQLEYLNDTTYKDSVAHAIKLLYLDIENKNRVRIGENIIPSKLLRNDLNKINYFVVEHAINKFKEASREKEIRNSVAYLKSCIYNSIHEVNLDIDKDLRYNGII